jgi:uncharacterized protein YtpQ (UPF0354 family)
MDDLFWHIISLVIVFLILKQFVSGQNNNSAKTMIRKLLENKLKNLFPDIKISLAVDDTLICTVNDNRLIIHVEQLSRICTMKPTNIMGNINSAALAIQDVLTSQESEYKIKDKIIPLFTRDDNSIPSFLTKRDFYPGLSLLYAIDRGTSFQFIDHKFQHEYNLNTEDLHDTALLNLERTCNKLKISALEAFDQGDRFIRFITYDGLDAVRMLIPSFYSRFSPRFNEENIYVLILGRDYLVMTGENDKEYLNWLTTIGNTKKSFRPYPITDVQFKITENNIEAVENY